MLKGRKSGKNDKENGGRGMVMAWEPVWVREEESLGGFLG